MSDSGSVMVCLIMVQSWLRHALSMNKLVVVMVNTVNNGLDGGISGYFIDTYCVVHMFTYGSLKLRWSIKVINGHHCIIDTSYGFSSWLPWFRSAGGDLVTLEGSPGGHHPSFTGFFVQIPAVRSRFRS